LPRLILSSFPLDMADTKSGGYVVKGAEGIFKLAASFAPVPGLAPAVDLLFAILIVFDNVRTNKCVVSSSVSSALG
jgi:hypothetical protein